MTSPGPASTRATGYANGTANWWQMVELEETPELRWPQSIPVYRRMRTQDSQVSSVLRAVTSPIMRTRWYVEPGDARPEVAQQVADDLGLPLKGAPGPRVLRTRDHFSWREHLQHTLLMLSYGHMFFEPEYRFDDRGMARLRKLGARPPWTISKIDVAQDGGLVAIEQPPLRGETKPRRIEVDHLVAYVYERDPGNWLGNSLLRAAYKNWFLKDPTLRVWFQTIQRNGMGIPLYTAAEEETDLEAGKKMAREWQAGDSAGGAIPNGSKMQLLGVEGELPDARPAVEYHDRAIAKAVLANFLNLDAQGGSYALASVQADTFVQSLQGVAEQIADVTTQHVVEDMVDLNWGPSEPAPQVAFEEIGTRQAATAQALKALFDAGAIFPDRNLEEALRQTYGLPPKDQPAPVQEGT